MIKRWIAVLAMAVVVVLTSKAEVIKVDTQQDFETLGRKVDAAVKSGAKEVDVVLAPKTFYFSRPLLNFNGKRWEEVSISLSGTGGATVITPAQETLRDTTPPSGLMQCDRLIEVVDEGSKLCRLRLNKTQSRQLNTQISNFESQWSIRITQWFKSLVYDVESIDRKWIYFRVPDLSYNKSYGCYNVNLDYGYSHRWAPGREVMPRFRLESAQGKEKMATRLLSLSNCRLAALQIEGVSFVGSGGGDDYLIKLNDVKADSLVVKGCRFSGIRCGVMQALDCENVRVKNNAFSLCHRYGVYAGFCVNTVVTGNTFERMGLACTNSFCVRCSGKNYLVADNEFCDFGYGGIAMGTWWQTEKHTDETGVVERNHLYYTPAYMADWVKHSLMDSGAIYVLTQNDDVHIRHNNIHDYNGACDNRGIFCDDGASNMHIYDNTIRNISNSYSIDSRLTLNIETHENSKVRRVNVNNSIYNNDTDRPIRFEKRPE